MTCPICTKRKAKRFCPAKGGNICSVCCATEREVTLDCPSDCPYLIASRHFDQGRRGFDRSQIPYPETKIDASFLRAHQELLLALSYRVCQFARQHPELVDADVGVSLARLVETYRTLSSGLYYEQLPNRALERELYEALKATVADFKQAEARRMALSGTRDSDIRDALIFLAKLGAMESNGRPKGRAYLDFLRHQFRPDEFAKPASSIVLP